MKGIKNWFKLFVVCISLAILYGCSEELQVDLPVDNLLSESIPEFSTEEVELVMIPTPVQTPTILVHSKCTYNPDHIAFDNLLERSTTSNLKAISLGICIVDFSYAGVNKDHITAKEKLENCLSLMDELGIDVAKDEVFLERIEKNMENPDSLSYYVLSAFEKSTQYFKNSDKEELGIAILSGTALESSLLLTQDLKPSLDNLYFTFFSQQKQYARGLEVIMKRYEDQGSMKLNIEIARSLEGAFTNYENWATSADSSVNFEQNKEKLINELLALKENCYH
jgi:hypothetical protein